MAQSLRIHEIYQSIQGESTLAGLPCTFIRLAGCPLQCVYCDTPQAIPMDSGASQSVASLLAGLQPVQTPVLLVTGGEPLAQKNCIYLLQALLPLYQHVQLETSGAYDIALVPQAVSIILDIKTPASGECVRNRWQNMALLRPNTELKFVLNDEADYVWAKEIIQKYDLNRYTLLMSCVWQALDPQDLAAWIVRDQLDVRLQLQLHKYIWGAKATGV